MRLFQPWNGTVRIITGGWLQHPQHRGERFDDFETTNPVHKAVPVSLQAALGYVLFLALWLPKRII